MEKLKALWGDAAQYLSAASPREKRMVLVAAAGVALFVLLIGWGTFRSSLRKREDSLDEKRASFEKIQKLAVNYNQREQERQLMEARLRQSPPALMSFVDGLAKKEGIEIGGMSDRGVVSGGAGGKPKESSVEVNLGKVPMDKLMRLLESIDLSPGVVRVRRLRVRRALDAKETLDVSLTISAWQGA